jgi:hypothetical protein
MVGINEQINNVLMRVYKRAENLDTSLLEDTFVPIVQVDSILSMAEHHVLYGRRGTGKTHTLRRLEQQRRIKGGAALYVDLRIIGSEGGLYCDQGLSLPTRATTLLIDVVTAIHEGLLELALKDEKFIANLNELSDALDLLASAATEVKLEGDVEQETTRTAERQEDRKSGLKLTASGSSVGFGAFRSLTQSRRAESIQRRLERGQEKYHIVFETLASAFSKVASAFGDLGLWLMLDEWSSLPVDLQPYLADMLRRSVFVPGIAVKIGAIERRSRFMKAKPGANGDYIGIELGAEASVIDIDEYLTFEQGAHHAQAFFARLLFRHAGQALKDSDGNQLFESEADFAQAAFASDAFIRFVEGSEGLPRDALEIAQKCASQAIDQQIALAHVNSACTSYFLQSKEGRLSEPTGKALREIIRKCVEAESRLIALRRPLQSQNEIVAELYDQRLIHRRGQGVFLPDKPVGEPYDVFLVDLGCFVELISRGQLRLVDHGLRDLGIVSTNRDRPEHKATARERKAGYALIPAASRWQAK